jgi:hypothetical protein
VKEPTYLMVYVDVISTYKCYNTDPKIFEQLLRRFFADVNIHDDKGRRITPREWFAALLAIINKVIDLILSGDIVYYKYDVENRRVVR